MYFSASLLDWFYEGLGGIGGWALFAASGLLAATWLLVDSRRRALPVRFEQAKVIGAQLFSVPAVVMRLTSPEAAAIQDISVPHQVVFYMGLLGGLIPATVAAYYAISYYDKIACRHGHPPYPRELARCPHCAMQDMTTGHGPMRPLSHPDEPRIRVSPRQPGVPHAHAWLVTARGRRYMLFQGENSLGRGADMDFQLAGDQAVSRHHARIVEREGQFTVMDCGSKHGTRLNGRLLAPHVEEELRSGDVIALSEHTRVTFVLPEDWTSPG
jgi:hypothetical protein